MRSTPITNLYAFVIAFSNWDKESALKIDLTGAT